jgi:hypothetical protein
MQLAPMTKTKFIKTALLTPGLSLLSLAVFGSDINSKPGLGASDAAQASRTLIGIQYENWFTPHNAVWDTAEAIPTLGKYDSYDANVLRKHFEWFNHIGIDWLLIDWSNMLWSKPAWESDTGATRELKDTVAVMFKTAAELEREGKYAPKMVFMLGLQNGPPVPDGVKRLNGIIAWIKANYLDNPAYKNLWLRYDGKPLLTILYFPSDPCSQIKVDLARSPLEASDWTVRWMASQLQYNHADSCGMWSWMDGDIRQTVTRHDGKAEEVVVTPSCFQLPSKGWRHPTATGRDHGAPYIDSWRVAFQSRPRFIQVHQWNEFAGQKEGEGMPDDYWPKNVNPQAPKTQIYGDEYNLELSDDIEPTRMNGCAYRGCGGWGYYYMNLTKTIISLYRGETPDATVMALSGPFQPAAIRGDLIPLRWSVLGKAPAAYTISVDEQPVARSLHGLEYSLDCSKLSPGKHRITLLAGGAKTYYDLDPSKIATKSAKPLPVTSSIEFTYAGR